MEIFPNLCRKKASITPDHEVVFTMLIIREGRIRRLQKQWVTNSCIVIVGYYCKEKVF
jgi:hypothetical protein